LGILYADLGFAALDNFANSRRALAGGWRNDIVVPLPADLQSPDLVYMAGSPAAAEQPVPAKALIDFLTAPAAAPVYKANGMEPG
jgi:ABC-type molybdate transport system substrate-binding protein